MPTEWHVPKFCSTKCYIEALKDFMAANPTKSLLPLPEEMEACAQCGRWMNFGDLIRVPRAAGFAAAGFAAPGYCSPKCAAKNRAEERNTVTVFNLDEHMEPYLECRLEIAKAEWKWHKAKGTQNAQS